MLDSKSEKTIAQVVTQAREAFGPSLVCLALYGSAATGDFVPGRSDLNFAIVLDRITATHLRALHRRLAAWRARGVGTPLLLDHAFLARGRDVFPLEFLDITSHHRVLYGEELFATLQVDPRHLRYQAEHEARSKLLRLRTLYAEIGAAPRRLQALMLDSVKTFLIIMRTFLRLRGGTEPSGYANVLERFERESGASFPTMHRLLAIKLGTARWDLSADDAFAVYLDEVERLVDLIDQVLPHAGASTL